MWKLIIDSIVELQLPTWGIPGWASVIGAILAFASLLRYVMIQRKKVKSLYHIARGAIVAMELCNICRDVNHELEDRNFKAAKDKMRTLRNDYMWLAENHHNQDLCEPSIWLELTTCITDVGNKINGFNSKTSLDETKPSRDALDSIGDDLRTISAKYENYLGQQ